MDGETLFLTQLELECKGIDPEGSLIRIPGEEPDDIELVAVAETSEMCRLLVNRELSRGQRHELQTVPCPEAFAKPQDVVEILARGGVAASWKRLRSFVASQPLRSAQHPGVVQLGSSDARLLSEFAEPSFADYARKRPVFAAVLDNRVVSACTSSRENERAGEAWVFTDPGFRGRGFAKDVVAAWASFVLEEGKVAFYSYDESNQASGAIAQALNFHQWLSLVTFTGAD